MGKVKTLLMELEELGDYGSVEDIITFPDVIPHLTGEALINRMLAAYRDMTINIHNAHYKVAKENKADTMLIKAEIIKRLEGNHG